MEMAHSVLDLLVCLTLEINISENKSSRIFTALRDSILLVLAPEIPFPFRQITICSFWFGIALCVIQRQVVAVQISICL